MHTWSYTLNELEKTVREIRTICEGSKIFFLYGEVGSGKTTFVTEFCRQLGYTGEVSSPTFSLANVYQNDKIKIFHLDLYRIKNAEEALDMGIEDYLYNGDICLVEWPQAIESLVDSTYCRFDFKPDTLHSRQINVTYHDI